MKSRVLVSLLAGLPVAALLLWLPAADVRADVTISTATTAPQYGDGGTFTVTPSGTITSGGGDGVVAQPGNAITTLTVDGVVDTSVFGVRNFSGSTISGVGVSGTIQGSWGLLNEGAITSMSNGGLINGTGDWGLQGAAGSSFGTLTNTGSGTIQGANYGIGIYGTSGTIANAGLVKGTAAVGLWTGGGSNNITLLQNTGTFTGGQRGVQLVSGTIATFDNAGLVNGDNDWGFLIESAGSLGALTNSGTIQSAFHGIGVYGTSGTISNTGVVNAPSGFSVFAEGDVSQFSNTGVLTATAYGAYFKGSGLFASASNSGLISGGERAFQAENGSLGSLTNSGTMTGGNYGVLLYGTTGTVANLAGALISATTNDAVYLVGTVTQLSNAGTITAGGNGVYVYNAVTTATNSGLIQGHYGIKTEDTQPTTVGMLTNSGTIEGVIDGAYLTTTGTVLNLAGGRIAALNNDALYANSVGLFSNAGTISGVRYGAHFFGPVTTATNSGLIESDFCAAFFQPGSVLGSLTNSGTIRGGSEGLTLHGTSGTVSNLASGLIETTANSSAAVVIADVATIPSFVNEGRIISTRFGFATEQYATLSTLTNSGTIAGQSRGGVILASAQGQETLSNSGLISGFTVGVWVLGGPLNQLINTGTITYTGTGTGPAVFVNSGGVLGVASGTSGVALSSTGPAARLNGEFRNRGTVYHGFTVDNQDVTISAGGGAGTFTDGTLTMTNGNLTFTSGTTTVAAGVSANAGAGLVTNEAGSTVRFIGLANRTVNFQSIANSGVVEFQQAVAGSLARPINGTGSVLKTGTGDLTLAGTSNYTGATTVSAGRLSVNGSLGNTPMAVLAAAELGGSGAIGGPVSVANGGFLSPGNSIESLATGTVTFAAGATFEYEINSTNPLSRGSAADLLVVSGDLNLDTGNGSLLTVTDLAGSPNPFADNTTMFALINYSGVWNGGLFKYAGNVLTDGGMFTVGSQQWLIDYNSSTGGANFTSDYLTSSSFVTITAITAIPEPSTCIMALAGLACGGFSMWWRRKRA